jgi:rod shape-determining protein MreC
MYNLLRFLQRYQFVFIFLGLEFIALMMLARSHTYQRAKIINASSGLAGYFYDFRTNFSNVFTLQHTNDMLAKENAELRKKLEFYRQQSFPVDTLTAKPAFEYIPARVISNTVHLRNNYIVINKGSRQGIAKDMGVMSSDGIAGIITGVTENYSVAISLLHKYANISVSFLHSDQLANVTWNGPDFRIGNVIDIPTYVNMKNGDTLVTSGNSFIFPEGIIVGTIDEPIESAAGDMNTATMIFATDFNKLKSVYVIKNSNKFELNSLNTLRPNE